MIRPEPWQSAVRLMSQAGPGPGFGFLDLEHAMLVRAPQLHVQRLAALAVPDHHGPSLGAGFPSVPPLHQYDQGREQVMAFFGEQVLMAFTLAGFAIHNGNNTQNHSPHDCATDAVTRISLAPRHDNKAKLDTLLTPEGQ